MHKDAIDNPAALFARMRAARIERITRVWKIWTLADICTALINQELASSRDVITSGGRKSETTMEDKLIWVVCGYSELYNTTSYFYRNRNKFSNETVAGCRSPSNDANSRLLCSEFHTNEAYFTQRMNERISRANEAYFTCKWSVFHARMKRISRANEAYFTCEWSVFHARMKRISRANEAYFTHEWSVFHVRIKLISRANEASKLKMFKCPTTRIWWRFKGSRFFIICHIHNHTGYNR